MYPLPCPTGREGGGRWLALQRPQTKLQLDGSHQRAVSGPGSQPADASRVAPEQRADLARRKAIADDLDDRAAGLVRRLVGLSEVRQGRRGERRRDDELERVSVRLEGSDAEVAEEQGAVDPRQQLTNDPRRVAPRQAQAEEVGEIARLAEGVPGVEPVPSLLPHDVVEHIEEVPLVLDRSPVNGGEADGERQLLGDGDLDAARRLDAGPLVLGELHVQVCVGQVEGQQPLVSRLFEHSADDDPACLGRGSDDASVLQAKHQVVSEWRHARVFGTRPAKLPEGTD